MPEAARRRMGAAGRARILAEHTAAKRAATLERELSTRASPAAFNSRAAAGASADAAGS